MVTKVKKESEKTKI